MKRKMLKFLYYFLNIVWGFPLTMIGALVALALLCAGKKPKKWGGCLYFEVGKNWGGLELGLFFLVDPSEPDRIKNHEFGHSFQNAILGVFTIPLIAIPSAFWYWYRKIRYTRRGIKPPHDYDWFVIEGMATKLGTMHRQYFEKSE